MAARAKRKGWTHEQAAVEGDLRYWGPRYRRILLSEGYQSFSPFAGLMEGRSNVFSTRILIPDMTERAWETNMRVWALPTDFAWALVARYSLPPRDEDGSLFTGEEIGAVLGCTAEAYRQRVHRGRDMLRRSIFTPVTNVCSINQ